MCHINSYNILCAAKQLGVQQSEVILYAYLNSQAASCTHILKPIQTAQYDENGSVMHDLTIITVNSLLFCNGFLRGPTINGSISFRSSSFQSKKDSPSTSVMTCTHITETFCTYQSLAIFNYGISLLGSYTTLQHTASHAIRVRRASRVTTYPVIRWLFYLLVLVRYHLIKHFSNL